MAIYKFRATFEEYDDVSRDIEIKSNQTFADLHQAIQQAINFDAKDSGHFFASDDYWRKGDGIGKGNLSTAKLHDFIEDPHQKFIYEFGENGKWSFTVELIKILAEAADQSYPKCVKTVGKAPAQYINIDHKKISEEDAKASPLMASDLIDDSEFYSSHDGKEDELFDDDEQESNLVEEGEYEEEQSEEEDEFGAEFSDNEHPEEDY